MRLVFLGNNTLGLQVLSWLRKQNENVVALVLNAPSKRSLSEELLRASGLSAAQVIDGSRLDQPEELEKIRSLTPELGLSVSFGHILRRHFLDILPKGCLNLHTSLLPYNRGAHPNVWSIVEGTPAGVTLHYVDDGVDTGDIVAQEEVAVEAIDTGATLYRKLQETAFRLFIQSWPLFKSGRLSPRQQDPSVATVHRVKDLITVDQIDLDRSYKARDLINLLRARTFPPYPGAWFHDRGRKVRATINLQYDGPDA